MDASPAIWEEDERSHRSGVGRWAHARSVVRLFVASICCCALDCRFTRASETKAERHHAFFVFRKMYEVARLGHWICLSDWCYLNNTTARRLPLAERRKQ